MGLKIKVVGEAQFPNRTVVFDDNELLEWNANLITDYIWKNKQNDIGGNTQDD